MAFVVGGMAIIFLLVGIGLVLVGIRDGLVMWQVRPRMQAVEGVVTKIETKSQAYRASHNYHTYHVQRYPVIYFHTQNGERRSFCSEMGEVETRYRPRDWFPTPKRKDHKDFDYYVGKTVPVLYDPLEQVTPRIDSWAAVWGGYLIQVMAGFVFAGSSALIWFAFGTKIVTEIGDMLG
ncbi:MAG: DUF3592 domain-containing protein [Caldilineaceae bacterium]